MHKKATLLNLGICFVLSFASVFILQLFSSRSNGTNNQFIRLFPPHIISGYEQQDLTVSNYYFAGIFNDKIFLSRYSNPENILIYSRKMNSITLYKVSVPDIFLKDGADTHVSVDSCDLVFNQYSTGAVFRFSISDSSKLPVSEDLRISTSICLPMKDNYYAICIYNQQLKENVLGRFSFNPSRLVTRPNILERQIDGVFSTDGMLRYDRQSSIAIYAYLYRNQFICMDSLLKVKYRALTIDTNTFAKIKIMDIASQNSSVIASPGFYVNREVCINSKWIFVNSGVKADNENEKDFKVNSVVDVYSLANGKYHFSFYIPSESGKISGMLLDGNTLFTIQDRTLFAYSLDLSGIRI